jgi:hypothetical protein
MLTLGSGCDSEPTRTTANTPVDGPTFDEMREQWGANEVAVLYYAEIQGVSGELLWRKSGEFDRWDFFYRHRQGCCGWESVLARSGQLVEACSWEFESRSIAEAECSRKESFALYETLEPPLHIMDLAPTASREYSGGTAYCYVSEQLPRAAAYACFASDARLLNLVVQFGVRGPAWLHAQAVWPDEPGVQLTDLPRDVVQGADIDDLGVPMLPALRAYLDGEENPIREPE